MSTPANLLFLGLPETGKTSYFVALDEVLQRQTDSHGLVSSGFSSNRSYIEKLKEAWRAGRSVERTKLSAMDEPVELLVEYPKVAATAHLVAPDISGEFFDDQWTERRWPSQYRKRLSTVAGLFLFVHAKHNSRNEEMSAAWARITDAHPTTGKPWNARNSARQLKVVDLLQFIATKSKIRKPCPLAVIISAWDLVERRGETTRKPSEFLGNEWPLLSQFLLANSTSYTARVFGVSARGGDDSASSELVRLAPHERVWLRDDEESVGDLTRPLRWLLNWD